MRIGKQKSENRSNRRTGKVLQQIFYFSCWVIKHSFELTADLRPHALRQSVTNHDQSPHVSNIIVPKLKIIFEVFIYAHGAIVNLTLLHRARLRNWSVPVYTSAHR